MNRRKRTNLGDVAQLYTSSLQEHGAAPKGVGWGDAGSHALRFDKLATAIEPDEPVTVNDLGCGYGAFFEYLVERDFNVSHFRGYDISKPMLTEARRRISADKVDFKLGNVLEDVADYSFASGIFNVRLDCEEQLWTEHIFATLENMNACSAKGFAFNLLTSYVDWQENHLYYGDPAFFFDKCVQKFSRHVALLHDYPLWEWTIVVRK